MLTGGGLAKRYGDSAAVADASLALARGETVALAGRSGSGKSTLARLLACLIAPDRGTVYVDGRLVPPGGDLEFRRAVQFLAQDFGRALNPAQRVATLLDRPLRRHRIGGAAPARRAAAIEALAQVGLEPAAIERFPHELSGGQRQRVALARVLLLEPRYLILDEPFSALDIATTAEILDLLRILQRETGFGCLLVTHDLDVAAAFAERLAVMEGGRIVETGPTAHVLAGAADAATRALLAARRRPMSAAR
ncbi:MAG: ABC transporter ATP-binding protein [Alphaproteobacteria bacterium]|nr:ABC transporter ATP-binding protein [Alphaproteobacteria bacterium]